METEAHHRPDTSLHTFIVSWLRDGNFRSAGGLAASLASDVPKRKRCDGKSCLTGRSTHAERAQDAPSGQRRNQTCFIPAGLPGQEHAGKVESSVVTGTFTCTPPF